MKIISFKSGDRTTLSAFCQTVYVFVITVTSSVAGIFGQDAPAQVAPAAAPIGTNSTVGQFQFTTSNGFSISVEYRGGDVPGVSIPNGSSAIRCDSILPASFVGKEVRVSSVDGGSLTASQRTANALVFSIGSDRRLNFTYMPNSYPGTYRILLEAGSSTTTLKFVVRAATDSVSTPGLAFH